MSLLIDAKPSVLSSNVSEDVLNKDILWKIENDLSIDEKISILFLMITDYQHSFREICDLLQNYKNHKVYILTEFINKYPENWKSKLLESICIIQNRQIIRKLGISFEDLDLLYLPKNGSCSRYLNLIAKSLYLLCEALSEDKIKLLLQYVRTDLTVYEEYLKDVDFLELHMLYWMQVNYISIYPDGKVKLENLLKHLKIFKDLEHIYEDLKKYENHQNVLDTQRTNSTSISQIQTFSMREEESVLSDVEGEDIRKLNNGLCIIISQMRFSGQQFETRFGTVADRMKLSETFQRFGFTIEVFNDLTKDEILTTLENIPKDFGTDYDCIFVCILSHGCKGGIISADEKEVSIEAIEHKFCCIKLKDVIKVVIIQACQGKMTGQINDDEVSHLVTDGPLNCEVSSILPYKNFCIFMSTMQGFISVRHKEEGSWFIQEFCNILQNGGNKITFLKAIRKTIQSVMKKKGKLNGTNSIAQLPELKTCRLLMDFQLPDYRANI
ncbi:caspase-8-like [Bombus vosnesenskii]|uniref:Caspase-8-like n=1 Tax=Bombus vosnesenskii TaxID=207650 RepID=A0A6J3KAZ6_9HYME|nr:caspase-8-like [Bombus vosnesenskii]XP_033349219.1 caspase-8-like [Bombus vosnesenskii]